MHPDSNLLRQACTFGNVDDILSLYHPLHYLRACAMGRFATARPFRWAQQRGIMAQIAPATSGGLRGAAAAHDLQPYDAAVSVPGDCLITADTALSSDIVSALSLATAPHRMPRMCRVLAPPMGLTVPANRLQGKALQALGLHSELVLLLFTMVDRHEAESPWAPFWSSLPQTLVTGRRVLTSGEHSPCC